MSASWTTWGAISLVALGSAILPAAVGIANLHHNLYDIDRLICRTLVNGSFTALLLLGFVARNAVKLNQLTLDLTSTVSRTMQPEHVSVWLPSTVSGENIS